MCVSVKRKNRVLRPDKSFDELLGRCTEFHLFMPDTEGVVILRLGVRRPEYVTSEVTELQYPFVLAVQETRP